MYPLKLEVHVRAYHKVGPYGDILESFPARKVKVFSWALVSGNAIETKEFNAIVLSTIERLQIIAPVGTFRRPANGETLESVLIEGQIWALTDTEEKHEANPWWSPGLSVFWFDREVADYDPPLPGGEDEEPEEPEEVPEAYKFNPYATSGHALYDQGVGGGGPYGGGTNFKVGDTYNPYNDQGGPYGAGSPFHGEGGGPYGEEWPAGQSAEARNAYQTTLGNVGEEPEEPTDPADPEEVAPEDIPAYQYNPYADEDNTKYDQGAGGPYGGTNFFVGDNYNPYADQRSPFYKLGAGDGDPYGWPMIPPGTEWPAGQSAEARNAYQTTLGNVG